MPQATNQNPQPKRRFADETVEQREKRLSGFRSGTSEFFDPSVLSNLGVGEDEAEDFLTTARRWYDEDLAQAREEDPKARYSFGEWAHHFASSLSKIDPSTDAGKQLNPVRMAELMREIERMQGRTQAGAEAQYYRERGEALGTAGNIALGVGQGVREFARTASGGGSEMLATGLNRLVGGEEQAQRYQQGAADLDRLTENAAPGARFGRGFGGLLGFIAPAGATTKIANGWRLALEAGKSGLKQGTLRYGLNRAVAIGLGGAEGLGAGSRYLASIGNFAATEFGLTAARALNESLAEAMAGGDGALRFAQIMEGDSETGEGGLGLNTLQGATSGALMPALQRVGRAFSSRLAGGATFQNRILKTLREMPSFKDRVQAVLARSVGGAAEFSGFALLPDLHNPNGPFGIIDDFKLLMGEDSPERTAAQERLLFHALNGALLKNMPGHGVIEPSTKQRGQLLAGGLPRDVGVARFDALHAAAERENQYYPSREAVESLRQKPAQEPSPEEAAAGAEPVVRTTDSDIGRFVIESVGRQVLGKAAKGKDAQQIIEALPPDAIGEISRLVTEAEALVRETGAGIEIRYSREAGAQVHPVGGRNGMSPAEASAMRESIKEVLDKADPEERDAIAANIVMQEAMVEAAARMGGQDIGEGNVGKAMREIADAAIAGSTKETPEQALRAIDIEIQDRTERAQNAANQGRPEEAAALAQEIQTLQAQRQEVLRPEMEKQAKAEQKAAPEGSEKKPLTPGENPKPYKEKNTGKLTWPPDFAKSANGAEIRVQVGKVGADEGLFRRGQVVATDEAGGEMIVRTADGQHFVVTPEDVLAGRVRGDLFRGLERPPSEGKGTPRFEAKGLTRDANDSVESLKEIRDPEARIGDGGVLAFPPETVGKGQGLLPWFEEHVRGGGGATTPAQQPKAPRRLGGKPSKGGSKPPEPPAAAAPPKGGPPKPQPPAPQGARPVVPKDKAAKISGEAPYAPSAPEKPAAAAPAPAAAEKKPARFGSKRTKTPEQVIEQQARIIERKNKRIADERLAANTDALTGVSNRRGWKGALSRLEQKQEGVEREKWPLKDGRMIAAVDLTNVGITNNNRGEPEGDKYLLAGSGRLKEIAKELGIPERDIFRTGGDEFKIIGTKEQIVKLGNMMSEITSERGRLSEIDLPEGKIVQRVLLGVGSSLFDATKALNDAKEAFGKESKRQGWLSKDRDPSKGWKPAAKSGAAAPEPTGLPSPEAKSGGTAPLYTRVKDRPNEVVVRNLPKGMSVSNVVRSGRNFIVIIKDGKGGRFVLRKNGGYHAMPADMKEPEPTKNAVALDDQGNVLYRGPLVLPEAKVAPEPKGVSTGGLETREQAEARLGSFRRANVVDEKGVQIKSDDPVRRAYIAAGALAARESVKAADVKNQIDTLMQRRNKIVDEKGEQAPEVARIDGALSALHSVHRAKTFIENLDKQIEVEQRLRERSLVAANPATGLEFSDASMGTAQRTARDLATQYVAWLDSKMEEVKGRGNVRDLTGSNRTLYEQLQERKKVAQSILNSSPYAKMHGPIRTAEERLPELRTGDVVQIVHGGRDAPHHITGLVVGHGEANEASLKRGRGAMGFRYRRALERARRGEILSVGDKELLRSVESFPGKWVSLYTREGNMVRVRVSDITEIGPEKMTNETFAGRGAEVTERRFLSWFTPPEELVKSRNPHGTGSDEESAERTRRLLAGDRDDYDVVVRKQEDGKEIVVDIKPVSPLEAAETEAKVRASRVVNGTATSDMYRLEAAALLAPPEARKSYKVKERVRQKPGQFGIETVEGVKATTKEEATPDRWYNPFTEMWEDQPTFRYVPRFYDPSVELRQPSELTPDERREYDTWMRLAAKREAQEDEAAKRADTYDETRKEITPLHINEEKGEWLFMHRLRGEGGALRDGRIVLAQRTPEGTIHARYVRPQELRDFLKTHNMGDKWEEWKQATYTERRRMSAENNRMLAAARGDSVLKDYLVLLENQLEKILKSDTPVSFAHEGDLHAMARKWREENPPPAKGTKEYDSWLRDAENFLFAQPRTDKKLLALGGEREEVGEDYEFSQQETGVVGEVRGEAGPMWLAAERVRGWRNPANGERFRVTDDGRIEYENADAANRDFYKAATTDGGPVLGLFGLGMLPGGASRMLREIIGGGFAGLDATLRGWDRVTRPFARLWSGVTDGVTDTTKNLTDAIFFDRIHDTLHHPYLAIGEPGETRASIAQRARIVGRTAGRLFGDRASSSEMRLHLNDYEGEFGVLQMKARKALAAFQKMPYEKQMEMLRQYERGNTPAMLAEYRQIMDDFGDRLVKAGLFTEDALKRFKGKYIHFGRWVWTKENIDKAIREQEAYIQQIYKNGDKGELSFALDSLRTLKNVKQKVGLTQSRVYIGDHPIDKIDRRQIQEFHRKGFARFRAHETLDEAIKAGLDVSQPHLLLWDGIIGEGKALAQVALHRAILGNENIVKPTEDAPGDWVHIVGTRYANDPVWKDALGKSIEPQAYDLIEATRPDHNGIRQVWDMFHGLMKQGLTTGNPANFHTQMLGNLYTLASKIPFFQLPTRIMRAALTLAGVGKDAKVRREQYDRWNWTRMAPDAIREIAQVLERGAWTTGAEVGNENPYAGMSIAETLGEAFRRLPSRKVFSGVQGFAQAAREAFTSIDAIARIALHEYNLERGVSEIDSRKEVDDFFDIKHLPKGWQAVRRYGPSFASIGAVMGRNLHRLAPATPTTILNMSMFAAMWNMVMQTIYGASDQEVEETIDASIPKNNAFSEWVGKQTALLMPDGEGRLRVIDMNRFSPTDVGLRSVPGLRSTVSGVQNLAMEGKWAGDQRGQGYNDEFANFAAGNIFYGPMLDWWFDRDRFSEGRGIREEMQNPGAFGSTGFLRFMLERGPLPGAISALMPPGMREAAATFGPSGTRALRRFGETSDTGRLGTPPRVVVGTDTERRATVEQHGRGRLLMDMLGFRYEEPNQYRRAQEEAQRREENLYSGRRGLTPEKGITPEEKREAKQTKSDVEGLGLVQKALRVVGMTRIARYNPEARESVVPLIQKSVGSYQSLTDMIRSLRLMEEEALARELQVFFAQDANRNLIPRPDRPSERMNQGRFGSQRAK